MSNQRRHIVHISKTPAMAECGVGEPSTTNFLPCFLDILTTVFTTFIAGIGALATTLAPLGENATFGFNSLVLSIRSLPWKVVGPIV